MAGNELEKILSQGLVFTWLRVTSWIRFKVGVKIENSKHYFKACVAVMNIFLLSRVMQTKTQMKTPLRFHIRYAVIQPRHKHRKKRTRIWVSVKNEIFPILTSEQSQRTECKQKRDRFSCVQRMQLNANLCASGLVLKKSRVTIMLTQRLFRPRRENR